MIKIIVYLSDGIELSGSYHYLEALARIDFARTLPGYISSEIVGAV